MYPMNPTGGEYMFGFPLIKKAKIRLLNGRLVQLQVKKINAAQGGIIKIDWNGKQIPVRSITHTDLLKGGTLTYYVAK